VKEPQATFLHLLRRSVHAAAPDGVQQASRAKHRQERHLRLADEIPGSPAVRTAVGRRMSIQHTRALPQRRAGRQARPVEVRQGSNLRAGAPDRRSGSAGSVLIPARDLVRQGPPTTRRRGTWRSSSTRTSSSSRPGLRRSAGGRAEGGVKRPARMSEKEAGIEVEGRCARSRGRKLPRRARQQALVLAYASGKNSRKFRIRILPGDRVSSSFPPTT